MIPLVINGERVDLPDTIHTVSAILAHYKIDPSAVVVEHNGAILRDPDFERQVLPEDQVEILQFMGGG